MALLLSLGSSISWFRHGAQETQPRMQLAALRAAPSPRVAPRLGPSESRGPAVGCRTTLQGAAPEVWRGLGAWAPGLLMAVPGLHLAPGGQHCSGESLLPCSTDTNVLSTTCCPLLIARARRCPSAAPQGMGRELEGLPLSREQDSHTRGASPGPLQEPPSQPPGAPRSPQSPASGPHTLQPPVALNVTQ